MINKTKSFLIIMTLAIVLGGCSNLGAKNNIKSQLSDKYDKSFNIVKTWNSSSGHVSFVASPSDDPKHEFEGRLDPYSKRVNDNYIDTKMADRIGEYLTQEFQEVLPEATFLVEPSNVRLTDGFQSNVDITLDEWLAANYKDAQKRNGSEVGMRALIILPLDNIDLYDFNSYKEKVISIFETGRLSTFDSFFIKGGYLYQDEEMKQKILTQYTIGRYDESGVLRMMGGDYVDRTMDKQKVINRITIVTYLNNEFNETENEFKFKFEKEQR